MTNSKREALRGSRIGIIGLVVCIVLSILTSCGSYQSVTVKQVNETNFVTIDNDTISAKRRVLYNLQEDSRYKMNLKDGKCVTVISKIK